MSLGERIAAQRQKQAHIIEVPEWGEDGAPLLMYVSPVTAGDLNKIQRKHKDFLTNQTVDAMVDLLILKAGDADGQRLFTLADKVYLMGEPIEVISRISQEMFGDVASVEDFEKN